MFNLLYPRPGKVDGDITFRFQNISISNDYWDENRPSSTDSSKDPSSTDSSPTESESGITTPHEAVQILRHNFIEEMATFSQQQENYGEILSKNHQIEAFVEIF